MMTSPAATASPPNRLRLDNNEGGRMSDERAASLSACEPDVLRTYPRVAELQASIAERHGVEPSRVIVTAGADDAIDRCFRVLLTPGRSLILTAPTFQQFHRFAASTPATVVEVAWEDEFPTANMVATIDSSTAIVAIATPNNPTGHVAARADIDAVASALSGGFVLLDHAYIEFAAADLTVHAASLNNVIIVRTFSKAWGMAGCRVGYAIAPNATLAHRLRTVGNPYPVSGPSIAIVTRLLSAGTKAVDQHVLRVRGERERLTKCLARLDVSTTPSQANFVFADFSQRVDFVKKALASLRVDVRAFPERPELEHGIRVSLPDDSQAFEYLCHSFRVVLDPEVLLFDMDGVIADVSGSYSRCIRETAAHFGLQVTDDEVDAVLLAGESSNDWIVTQRLLSLHGKQIPLENIRVHFQSLYEGPAGYATNEKATVSVEQVRELVGKRPVGVVTGRPRAEAMDFLEKFKLLSAVRVVVCMEDAPAKPDPAPVRLALERLGASRAWMVGDSPDDMVAAQEAGVVPIGIASSSPRITALRQAGAATVLSELVELGSYLR